MNLFDLTGQVALVTGGNGGIGLAFAKGLLKSGATVIIWGRNKAKNADALDQLRPLSENVAAFVCDVTDEQQVVSTFAQTVAHVGKVDVCFANAGGSGSPGRLHEMSADEWKAVLDLNLTSVVNTYKPMIAHLLDRQAPGKLIVTSSEAALLGTGFTAGYGTTKAAVMGLTRALAIELGRNKIQVNAILPGFIETDMSTKTSSAFQQAARRRSASGLIGTLEQMEGVAVFLASKHSDYMTGQGIVLDGGHSIHPM